MMKVALLTRSLEVGGAETQLATLALGLNGKFDITVITFYGGGELEQPLRAAGIKLRTIGKRGRWDLFGFAANLVRIVRDIRPDVLQSFLGPPNLVAALLRPLAGSLVWGIRASDMDFHYYDWSHRLVFRAERALSKVPDRIVANSYAGRAHAIASGFAASRIEVIPNGIDTDRYRPDASAGATLRAQWSRGKRLIGLVARLDPMKDHQTFLAAVRLLVEETASVRFVCIGGGRPDFVADLKATAARLGLGDHLIWAGERRDVAAALNAFDLVTLTSAFGEGFPNAVGEAMATAVPCVVTDVGDAATIVDDCGVVVPPRSPPALAAAWRKMLSLSQSELRLMGAAARRRICEHFSVNAMLERTATLYRSLEAA